MGNSIVPSANGGSESPFEALKRTDDRGEHWSARELAREVNYREWRNFERCVGSAREAITALQDEPAAYEHIGDSTKSSQQPNGGVREISDYRLTRYGAYMALAYSDKPELKHYFATKTREAEVATAVPTSYAEALEEAARQQRAIEAQAAELAAARPKVERYDAMMDADGLLGMTGLADLLDVDVQTLTDWLVRRDIFRRQVSEAGGRRHLPRRSYQHSGHFEVKIERRGLVKFPVAYATSAGVDLVLSRWGRLPAAA